MTYFSLVLEKIQHASDHSVSGDGRFDFSHLLAMAEKKAYQVTNDQKLSKLGVVVDILSHSPTALALMQYLEKTDIRLSVLSKEGMESVFDVEQEAIYLSDFSNLSERESILAGLINLTHQLRRVWQYYEYHQAHESLSLKDYIHAYRGEEADADSISVLIAWELRQAGQNDLWRWWISSKDGDIALAFLEKMNDDLINQYNGVALKAAYDAWYADFDRLSRSDENAMIAKGVEYSVWGEKARIKTSNDFDSSFVKDISKFDDMTIHFDLTSKLPRT